MSNITDKKATAVTTITDKKKENATITYDESSVTYDNNNITYNGVEL